MPVTMEQCPHCGALRTLSRILETRSAYRGRGIRRRYVCHDCNGRYTTYEFPAEYIKPLLDKLGEEDA